jgi:protease I
LFSRLARVERSAEEQTMSGRLSGKTVAILVADGFEQDEMITSQRALQGAGARTVVVSPDGGTVRGWRRDRFDDTFNVDLSPEQARVADFDALLLPGGVLNPDTLRRSEAAVRFIRGFFHAGKPVAAICHGVQTLIEARVVRGRTLTSFPSVRTDLANAGANWVDAAVVVDHGLVTSRGDGDLGEFIAQMIEQFVAAEPAGSGSVRR